MTSHPYTCLCCALAFTTPQTQRTHYSTDLHRYNSKRAVAGLSPVDITTFNHKFNHKDHQPTSDDASSYHCEPCRKSFNSLAAHNNHLLTKKHQLKLTKPSAPIQHHKLKEEEEEPNQPINTHNKPNLEQLIEQRIQQAPKIQPNECLFCPRSVSLRFTDPEHALKHMLSAHGFFLPDQEYLVDKPGLLAYLAEIIAVWNVCLYCGTGFGGKILSEHAPHDHASLTRKGLESVRKHMCDKNHCKLAWDTEEQRLEYSDFFDYRASYKTNSKSLKSKAKANRISNVVEEDEWEDVASNSASDVSMADDLLPEDREAVLGDSPFELVLPNGVRLGHRSLRYIYKQNLLPYAVGSQSTQAGNRNIKLLTRLAVLSSAEGVPSSLAAAAPTQTSSALASRLAGRPGAKLASSLSNAGLIPSRGGGINFNSRASRTNPTDLVIKARNPGEAKMAGHHIRTFKDVHKRQLFQTRVACTSGNNQKHYRDPLLQ